MFKRIFIILIAISFLVSTPLLAANDWTDNPFVIDATEDKSEGGIIQAFEYHPNAADNDVLVEDAGGGILFKCRAPIGAANSEAEAIIRKVFDPPRATNGIYIKTIDGGTLYIEMYRTRN